MDDHDQAEPTKLGRTTTHGVPAFPAALLTVVLLAAIVAAAVLAGRWAGREAPAQADQGARTAVVRVAEQFAAKVNNYDSKTVDSYRSSITPMLSTAFKQQFSKAMTQIVGEIKKAKMVSKGQVLASGVSQLDADSAEVLVVADAHVKTVYDQRQRHFRWQVSLVKVHGHWLVDDFSPVA